MWRKIRWERSSKFSILPLEYIMPGTHFMRRIICHSCIIANSSVLVLKVGRPSSPNGLKFIKRNVVEQPASRVGVLVFPFVILFFRPNVFPYAFTFYNNIKGFGKVAVAAESNSGKKAL